MARRAFLSAAAAGVAAAMLSMHQGRIAPGDDLMRAIDLPPDFDVPMKKRIPVTTNAAPEPVAYVEPSRQVRRQRERLARKGRSDAFRSIWISSHRPHIGDKERARHAGKPDGPMHVTGWQRQAA